VVVTADVFADGHDELACLLYFRPGGEARWSSTPMHPLGNDVWTAEFAVDRLGPYRFVIRAALDTFATWRRDLLVRAEAGQPVDVELQVGASLVAEAAGRATWPDAGALREHVGALEAAAREARAGDPGRGLELAASPGLARAMERWPNLRTAVTSEPYTVVVDPRQARFSAWYEMFPRSASPDPSRSGTLADVEARLGYVAGMGFDTLYLPPIHPIGTTNRKGRDGSATCEPGDPGSPWAIGSAAGGHVAIHPQLGSFDDFDRLVRSASEMGIDVALDLAFNCSPDHPWVVEHPEWFARLPDGTIRYAENPPKRYEDVYPIDFSTTTWRDLWASLRDVVLFWVGHGVRVFRVDNPHTKPMRFWEWLISSVKAAYPDVRFLSEAFTRPRVMEHLAKLGFSQSYTYFTWRNEKWELESYLRELVDTDVADYFRPNFWPNTPDILHETLQRGGRGVFVARLVLAATLSSSFGIYGPAFELMEQAPRFEGSEEYLHSEKYEVRHWDLGRPLSLAPVVAAVNAARRSHPALQQNRSLRFHHVEHEQLIAYSKTAPGDVVVVVASLDATRRHQAMLHLDLDHLGVEPTRPYQVHDLLHGDRYQWRGHSNFVALDPERPAHVFHLIGPDD
jgi:starch synthase (maltosyl-transferring)